MELTKRLVIPRRASRPRKDSRARLFAAAAREFAARGFAATSVDRIAVAARVNKAMIYYHFGSKAGIYREILREMFQAVGVRARAAGEADASPDVKVALFVEAIAAEADARPHFPPIWFREVADGGAHLDDEVLRGITSVVHSLSAILHEGEQAGRFQPVNPMLVHGGIVAPLMLFFASARLRQKLAATGLHAASALGREEMVEHVRRVTLGLLLGGSM